MGCYPGFTVYSSRHKAPDGSAVRLERKCIFTMLLYLRLSIRYKYWGFWQGILIQCISEYLQRFFSIVIHVVVNLVSLQFRFNQQKMCLFTYACASTCLWAHKNNLCCVVHYFHSSDYATNIMNEIVRACFAFISRVCISYCVYLCFTAASCYSCTPSQAFNLSASSQITLFVLS